jgi:hypothetical protein
MTDNRVLISGKPVPDDWSHTEKDPATGLQKDYIVLTPEERAKGYKKPVRRKYVHKVCGVVTTMHSALAETYARNPYFYSGTYCAGCCAHFDLEQFIWEPDGEPMDPLLQEDWAKAQVNAKAERILVAAAELEKKERAEYERLKAKYG